MLQQLNICLVRTTRQLLRSGKVYIYIYIYIYIVARLVDGAYFSEAKVGVKKPPM